MSEQTPHFIAPKNVIIIGAGVVGLGIAWRLAQRGVEVTVFDKGGAGAGASHAAAGMLAACVEAEPGEEALVALGRTSQAQWPDFATELERVTGISVDLRREGILMVALTADDQARLHHHLEFQRGLGLPLEWIGAAELRRREPHLGSTLAGAIYSPQDHQVDNRKLVTALRSAAEEAGATIHEYQSVRGIVIAGERARGVTLADRTEVLADAVVLAAGAWSRTIEGVAPALRPPVRPLKGQATPRCSWLPTGMACELRRFATDRAADGSSGTAHSTCVLGAGRIHGAAQRRAFDPRCAPNFVRFRRVTATIGRHWR